MFYGDALSLQGQGLKNAKCKLNLTSKNGAWLCSQQRHCCAQKCQKGFGSASLAAFVRLVHYLARVVRLFLAPYTSSYPSVHGVLHHLGMDTWCSGSAKLRAQPATVMQGRDLQPVLAACTPNGACCTAVLDWRMRRASHTHCHL